MQTYKGYTTKNQIRWQDCLYTSACISLLSQSVCKQMGTGYCNSSLETYFERSSCMKNDSISAMRSALSSGRNWVNVLANARCAFVRICAFPSRIPADSSPFGSNALLKLPSLIGSFLNIHPLDSCGYASQYLIRDGADCITQDCYR